MKRIIKKVMPFVLAVLIVFQSVYLSVQTAEAAAVPEILYYTYWDLISTLYATCGYETTVDENVINNHGVTGKQVWDNFCTWVELHVKAHNELVLKPAVEELKNLVNTATDKGVSLSQDLYDLLKECFAEQVATGGVGQFTNITKSELLAFLNATSDYRFLSSVSTTLDNFNYYLDQGYKLNVVKDVTGYFLFVSDPAYSLQYVQDISYAYPVFICYATKDNRTKELSSGRIYSDTSDKSIGVGSTVRATEPVWVIKEGAYVANDTIGAQVSAGACPKEVPDVSPWIKNPAIPDEWRIVQPGETPNPDEDPDDNPEVLPVIIPINPTKPDTKPDTETTENPDTETTENPDKDKDPDKKKNPVVNPIINPDTGNVIDPNTGWDIDPSTGKLINPNTGELVDPDMSNPSSITNKFGDITKLFPFCIPFDLVRLIRGMSAEKKPPVFHYEHKFKDINYTFVVDVDLSDYDKYIKLFRYGMQIFYIIALMFLTSKISNYFA